MTEYRRPFTASECADGAWLVQAGNRLFRLSKVEADELVTAITGAPCISRHVVGAQ